MHGIAGKSLPKLLCLYCIALVNRTLRVRVILKILLSFSAENARPTDKDDLQSELATMRGMEPHPNILNYLGMCSETGMSAISA